MSHSVASHVSHLANRVVGAGASLFCKVLFLCCMSCSSDLGNPQADDARDKTTPQHNSKQTLDTSADPNANSTALITTSTAKKWVDEFQRDMDPANDGWDSELFADRASKHLNRLGELMVSANPPTADDLSSLLAIDFSCSALRPIERQATFADTSVTVRRPQRYGQDAVHLGASGLTKALGELTSGLEFATDKRFKFKQFRVTPVKEHIDTTTYFEISGHTPSGAIQRTATWTCRWEPDASGREPRLLLITVDGYEEVLVRNTNKTLFSDVTESVFRDAKAYDEQFRYGVDYWRARLENYLGIYFDGLHGLAVGDVNGDGLDDVYLCEPGGLPNRLFVQTNTGLVRDISAQSGVDLLDSSRRALFVDLDNDGDQDLVMPVERQIQFYSNNGEGQFAPEVRIAVEGETAYSLAAADYDQDGDLDVYACFYHGLGEVETNRLPAPIPLHDARTGGRNHLFRNEGNWRFYDATGEVGLDDENNRWSYAAVWEDYDNDGDQDLYVANDFGRNNLYRNDGLSAPRFSDVAGSAGAEDMNFGMSATFGDYNRDGWMDLYVSNMFSAAGGRITSQPGFQSVGSGAVKTAYQQMVRGNTLLENTGDGAFRDVSASRGVTMGRWAWGSLFADVNNDGWEDILVANGFVTGHLPGVGAAVKMT